MSSAAESRSTEERAAIIREWSDWFYDHADTFAGHLGMQLAYLWPAVIKATQIEVEEDSPIVQLLRWVPDGDAVPADAVIWDYIDVVPAED